MNKLSVSIIAGILLIAAVFGGTFYYRNLRGWQPAFGPSPDITGQPASAAAGMNKTGLPLTVPDGFVLETYASDLGSPRALAFDEGGTLLASIPSRGQVVALPDRNNDRSADLTVIAASGLNRPHGIAFQRGALYIAETDGVSRFSYDGQSNRATGKTQLFGLPGGGNHFTRTIGFGPDGKLYVSVGSSCNVCTERDWQRAKILVADADGSKLREFATGLRNSVFFTWRGSEMWATDMGRDLLGDNVPPDEVNVVQDGGFYGWPYCYDDRIHDDDFDPKQQASCGKSISPKIKLPAHSAPLGLAFIPGSWPQQYRGKLLIAYHGSWNRSIPTGYKIVLADPGTGAQSDFIAGWLLGNGAVGRPVDLLFDTNGHLFISDDKAGVIYRLSAQ